MHLADGAISCIEFGGSLLIVGYCIAALFALPRAGGIRRARILIADGVLIGLSFKVAATLLKTTVIHSWHQILMFAAILALRLVLKRLFAWERHQLISLPGTSRIG